MERGCGLSGRGGAYFRSTKKLITSAARQNAANARTDAISQDIATESLPILDKICRLWSVFVSIDSCVYLCVSMR